MTFGCSLTDYARWAVYAFKHHWFKRGAPRNAHTDILSLLLDPKANSKRLNQAFDTFLAGGMHLRSIEAAALAFHVNRTDELLEHILRGTFDDDEWRSFQYLLKADFASNLGNAAHQARSRNHKYFWRAISATVDSTGPIRSLEEHCHVICTASIAGDINSSVIYGNLASDKLHIVCDERLTPIFRRTFPHIDFIPTKRHYHAIHSLQTSLRMARHFCRLPHPAICRIADNQAYQALMQARHVATTYDLMLYAHSAHPPSHPVFYKPLPELQREMAALLPGGPKVGILWHSETRNPVRNTYGLPASSLERILKESRCTFVNLQYRANINGHDNVINPPFDRMNDLERLLALISQLDLVISPITTTANFAAMTGTPVLLQVNGLLFNSMNINTKQDALLPNTRYVHCRNRQDIARATDEIIHHINTLA